MNTRKICSSCSSDKIKDCIICKQPIAIEKLNSTSVYVTNKDYGCCLDMIKCEDCNLVQVKYELNPNDIIKLYSGMEDKEYLESAYSRGVSNYQQIIPILRDHLSKSARILEIGSGSGALVSLLRKEFLNTVGIEPSSYFCNYAKKKYDIDIKNMPFELLGLDEKFDAIVALDVIEHVVSPSELLELMQSILNDKGIVIIVTPNKDSFFAKIMGKRWWHIRPPHLFYFGDKSFNFLAEKYGFSVISKKFFYWNLSFCYLLDSVQKLLVGKSLFKLKYLDFNVKINMFDSSLYVLKKKK